MMVEELRQLLRENGWILSIRRRGNHEYVYARRLIQKEAYLTTREKLNELTKEEVLEKIK
jgi:uncharacterized protein YqgQ